MTPTSGVEHSHWALWTTWRSSPDLVRHIAEVAAQKTLRPARICVRYRGDEEEASDGEDLTAEITSKALKSFRELLIEAGDDALKVRISFVRSPTEILIGDHTPRRATVRAGVVLEVMSSDPTRESDVRETKLALAVAIERGRPRLVTRQARHGQSRRSAPPGSASRALEREVVGWPPPGTLPVLSVLVSLAVYAGVLLLLPESVLKGVGDLDDTETAGVVGGGGALVAISAFVAQGILFAPVEVSSTPNAARAFKWVFSTIIPLVLGTVVKLVIPTP